MVYKSTQRGGEGGTGGPKVYEGVYRVYWASHLESVECPVVFDACRFAIRDREQVSVLTEKPGEMQSFGGIFNVEAIHNPLHKIVS